MSPSLPLRLIFALCGGLLVGCGFAPLEFQPLMLCGLVIGIRVLRDASIRRGAMIGAAFGLGFFGLLVSWVGVLGIGVWVALVISQVIFLAVFGACACAVQRLPGWPLWWAALWVSIEVARSAFPLGGFPWGRLAFATVDGPLEGYARVLGTGALSGLVFLLAALLVYAWQSRTRPRVVLPSVAVVALVVGAGYVLPTGVAGPDADPQRIAVVQGGVPGTGADGLGEQREVLNNHIEATLTYADDIVQNDLAPPDAVFWPENASDIDPLRDQEAKSAIDGAAHAVGAPLLVGAVLDGDDGTSPENAGIVWDPDSGPSEEYIKRHLVPFGEYVPFRGFIDSVLPYVTEEIPYDMTPGDAVGILDLGPFVVGDMMCYDVAYDDAAYDPVNDGADVLAVQTNNATYTQTSQPDQQWQLARFRAIETGRDVIVPSTNGVSGVVDASGNVLSESDSHAAQVLETDVTTGTGLTLAVRYGSMLQYVAIAIALASLIAAFVASRRRRPKVPEEPPVHNNAVEPVG